MNLALAALEVLEAVQAIVAAPSIPLVVAELLSVASQLTTPGQQLTFLNGLRDWARIQPPFSGATDTDEAQRAQGLVTTAINEIVDNVRRGDPSTFT